MALYEAKEKIFQLENAIQKLDSIKKHLNQNIKDIKGEIHSCVSHNLEFLRGREVTLLNKVDEVVKQKEESLQQQQAQLNQALGVLRTRMALIKNDSDLDKKIAETLMQFNQIELSPGETPHIAFRADHMSLRECIQNYGRVDANALPLPSAFGDSKKPSVSLPRYIEEYEDVDHHIFYKTVEDVKGDPTTKSINVVIPKLSTRIEDWLQKRKDPLEDGLKASQSISNKTQSGCWNLNTPKSCSTPQDANSLNNWLSQIKHHADLEEEHNFEIVDNSCKKKTNGSNSALSEDLKSWLYTAPGYEESVSTKHVPSDNFFRHIPQEYKHWLPQAYQQISSLEEESETNLFQHISKEPSTWLRSRAYGKQMSQAVAEKRDESEQDTPAILKDETMSQWLAQSGEEKQDKLENGNNNCCKQDCWVQEDISARNKQEKKIVPISFQLEDICKANELCSTLMDCVSKPNCAVLCQQERSGVKNPLDPANIFSPLQLPQSEWLVPSCDSNDCEKMDVCDKEIVKKEKDCLEDSVKKDMFSHIADIKCDQWLVKPVYQTETGTSTFSVFKQSKEEVNIWLRQSQENSDQDMDTKMFNYNPPCKALSDWLISPSKTEIIDKEEEPMKEESEGWSICSTPTSFNGEQFCKDVNVATNYLQSWVL